MNFLEEIKNNQKPIDILKDLGAIIKNERKKRKINQKELSFLVSVSVDSISKIERRTENYNILTLLKIMKYFNLISIFGNFIEKTKEYANIEELTKIMSDE